MHRVVPEQVVRAALRPDVVHAVPEPLRRLVHPQLARGIAQVHAARPEVFLLRYQQPLCTPHLADACNVVRVEVGKEHIVQILRPDAARGQLLADRLPRLHDAVHERVPPAAEHPQLRCAVLHAGRTHGARQTGVHQKQSLRVLHQICRHRQPDARVLLQAPRVRLCRPAPLGAFRQVWRHADLPAVQNMDPDLSHRRSLLVNLHDIDQLVMKKHSTACAGCQDRQGKTTGILQSSTMCRAFAY